jgi:MFS family permease
MAQMIEINLRPDARTLRQFGFIGVAGFGFVAAIAWFEVFIFAFGLGEARTAVAGGFAALAALSGLFSLVYPKANLPIYLGITIATYPIGFVLSYVIMGVLFYLIIAPIGLLLRVFGQDPMARRILPEAESYWEDAPPARPNETYFKQF